MLKIAVLLTCYNRKEKTIKCLYSLYKAHSQYTSKISLKVILTDDGSVDGTSESVMELFPDTKIIKGNGKLYWAGGMRNSWSEALVDGYDGYLLLNDDVELYAEIFGELTESLEYGLQKYKTEPIFVGATDDGNGFLTYSGSLITSRFRNTYKRLSPNCTFQRCDVANANIMYVPQSVVNVIGIFSDKFSHGLADYDYTITANKHNIPVLLSRVYCGCCENDNIDRYIQFLQLNLIDRARYLLKPKGLAFLDQSYYMRKHFPLRLPIIYFGALMKTFFPRIYVVLSKKREGYAD